MGLKYNPSSNPYLLRKLLLVCYLLSVHIYSRRSSFIDFHFVLIYFYLFLIVLVVTTSQAYVKT